MVTCMPEICAQGTPAAPRILIPMAAKRPASKGRPGAKAANPFDVKVNKVKFDVLGKDRRGTHGAPSQAKQRSMQIRAATLLPEVARRGKTSAFVDRRFGERDRTLTQEEKMLERFSREKQTASRRPRTAALSKKRSIFNLDDGGDDDTLAGLTHLGQDVEDLADFSDPDADEGGLIDGAAVRRGHFGGGAEADAAPEDGPRSKAEVMKEIIAKSKFHRAERAKLREANESLIVDLDGSFDTVLGTLSRYDRRAEPRAAEDDYDAAMRQMLFDKRSKPTDRTLTAGEAAQRREAAVEAREARRAGRRQDDDSDDAADEADRPRAPAKAPATDTARDEQRADALLQQFCTAADRAALDRAYRPIVALSTGPSSVALGRAIRTRLGRVLRRLSAGDARPFYPARPTLLLLHLVGRVYSASDFHHVIATPASLLMAALLEGGRMTRPKHVLSALFLAQTLLAYHAESGRLLPELFNLLHLLLAYLGRGETPAYPGAYNRLIAERMVPAAPPAARPLAFEDLLGMEQQAYTPAFTQTVWGAVLHLVQAAADAYADCPAFPEYFGPLARRLPEGAAAQALARRAAQLAAARSSLLLQHHKPVALPMLTPDLDADDKDARNAARLKAAFRREFKGAKRELRRDNEFLARHEASERKRKDTEYRTMINRVYGTISNDR